MLFRSLNSQFVGISIFGKFAAGNLFAGKYLKTDGTNGVLGWGQPWSSRPSKVTGYIKYQNGSVNYSSTSLLPKGNDDIGSVYIALGDWEGEEAEGETWPVVIKTKNSSQLFNPNPNENAGLIAFGELDWDSPTAGDGMVKFEIPIEYYSSRKPTSIIFVASASKYGDYFTGSTASVMWLDDLELIYE